MAIRIVDNFNLSKQAPLDTRIVANSVIEALAGIDRLQRYDGLTVYIIDEQEFYRFTGGIEDSDFKIITSDKPAKRSTYVHVQGTPAKTWRITHNLEKFPSITVVDSAYTVVEGSYVYIDENTVELEFSSEFKGKAYLN
jgi:hypothetical protein